MFYFHLERDTVTLDRDGIDVPDIPTARAVAAERIATILREGALWDGKPLRMWVTDETKSTDEKLFSLNVIVTSDQQFYPPSAHGQPSPSPAQGLRRYFFFLRWPDRAEADREGTILLGDDEANLHARRIIRELKEAGGYDHPGLTMIVHDANGVILSAIPFVEGD